MLGKRGRAAEFKATYSDTAEYIIDVPSDAEGRPGYMLSARSKPFFVGVVNKLGERNDFRVYVNDSWDSLGCVCFGPASEFGSARNHADRAAATGVESGLSLVRGHVQVVDLFGGEAYRVEHVLPSGRSLIDWFFERNGWVMAAGVIVYSGQPHIAEACALDTLRTWRWTDSVRS